MRIKAAVLERIGAPARRRAPARFDQLNEAFDRLAGGHTVRQLLLPGGSSSTRSTNAPARPV